GQLRFLRISYPARSMMRRVSSRAILIFSSRARLDNFSHGGILRSNSASDMESASSARSRSRVASHRSRVNCSTVTTACALVATRISCLGTERRRVAQGMHSLGHQLGSLSPFIQAQEGLGKE